MDRRAARGGRRSAKLNCPSTCLLQADRVPRWNRRRPYADGEEMAYVIKRQMWTDSRDMRNMAVGGIL